MNIDRISHYLLHEFIRVFIRVLFFFILLLCSIEWFRQLRFVGMGYEGLDVLYYVLLMIPRNLAKAGPLVAVTMSLAVGWRLSQTSELVAIRALGFSLRSLLSVIAAIAFFCATMLFVSSEVIAPKTTAMARALRAEQLGHHYAMLKGRDLWIKLDRTFVHILTQGLKQPIHIYEVDAKWRIQRITQAANIVPKSPGQWTLEDVRTTAFGDQAVQGRHQAYQIWHANINPEVLDLLKLDLRFTHLKQLWHYLSKVPHLWRAWDYQMACYFLGFRLIQPFLFAGLVIFTFLMLLLPVINRERFWLFVSPLGLGLFFYLCFESSLPMMKVFHWSAVSVLAVPMVGLSLAILLLVYRVQGGRFGAN